MYFYCKQSDESRNNFGELCRSLASQLIRNSPVCLEYMYTKVLSTGAARSTSKGALQDIIHDLVGCHSDLYICVDGLDECEEAERKEILSLISRLVQTHPDARPRVLVAACAERDIEQSLRKSSHLELTKLHLHSDITTYLRMTADELSKKWPIDIKKPQNLFAAEIYERVAKRPEGFRNIPRFGIMILI